MIALIRYIGFNTIAFLIESRVAFLPISYNDIFMDTFWLLSLANEFNNQNVEKGISILSSLEFIYDRTTKLKIRLPDYVKENESS